jgi:hypothetical protein
VERLNSGAWFVLANVNETEAFGASGFSLFAYRGSLHNPKI